MLVVTPAVVPVNYGLWKDYTSEQKNPSKKFNRRKNKFLKSITPNDTIKKPCIAILYKLSNTDTILIWEKTLLNEVCPVDVIVANDGLSIATFDNWFSKGHGENVFTVYNNKGNVYAKYRLKDISPINISNYLTSVSSINWYKNAHYISNDRLVITFICADKNEIQRVYNIETLSFE